jgi:hypothetical protein
MIEIFYIIGEIPGWVGKYYCYGIGRHDLPKCGTPSCMKFFGKIISGQIVLR